VSPPGEPTTRAERVEVVIELDAPPGNLAVDATGRVFFTFHPEAKPAIKVAEVVDGGGFRPFPDESWQQPRDDQPYFISPLSVRFDDRGRLWVLDHADFGTGRPSLTAFDVKTRKAVLRFELSPELAGLGSMMNDFFVDSKRGFAYIADTSPIALSPALIVLDLNSGSARRVLEDHPSVLAEAHRMTVQGVAVGLFGVPLALGLDSIALSPDHETLFFGPLTGSFLSRVGTKWLRDETATDETIAANVVVAGRKPSTDGIVADRRGGVYLTAFEHDGIWRMNADGMLSVIVKDPELFAWPDGLHLDDEGRWLYVSVSELHRVMGRSLDELPAHRPYRIVRIPVAGARGGSAARDDATTAR
jgi:sugar lactone lactonase YvrE